MDHAIHSWGNCRDSGYHISSSGSGRQMRLNRGIWELDTKGGLRKNTGSWDRSDAMIFGFKVHGFNKSGSSTGTDLNFLEWDDFISLSYTYGVHLGPFRLGVEVGISGQVSLTLGTDHSLGTRRWQLVYQPNIDINGFVRVGGSLVAINAWAGGRLYFFRNQLNVTAHSEHKTDRQSGEINWEHGLQVENRFELLSGKIFVEARAGRTQYQHKFLEWWGLRLDTTIWNHKEGFILREAFKPSKSKYITLPGMPPIPENSIEEKNTFPT